MITKVECHVVLPFDVPEALLDPGHAGLVVGDALRELGPFEGQHPGELLGGHAVVEHRTELLQGQSQVLQGLDPVQPLQLGRPVVPVAGRDPRRRARGRPPPRSAAGLAETPPSRANAPIVNMTRPSSNSAAASGSSARVHRIVNDQRIGSMNFA